jgi:hypothetical protein
MSEKPFITSDQRQSVSDGGEGVAHLKTGFKPVSLTERGHQKGRCRLGEWDGLLVSELKRGRTETSDNMACKHWGAEWTDTEGTVLALTLIVYSSWCTECWEKAERRSPCRCPLPSCSCSCGDRPCPCPLQMIDKRHSRTADPLLLCEFFPVTTLLWRLALPSLKHQVGVLHVGCNKG